MWRWSVLLLPVYVIMSNHDYDYHDYLNNDYDYVDDYDKYLTHNQPNDYYDDYPNVTYDYDYSNMSIQHLLHQPQPINGVMVSEHKRYGVV
jgi:hypothetical protein